MRPAAPVLALLPALLPRAASACAVCFGGAQANKGLIDGFWWGIVVLLTVTMAMVGGIGWLLYKVEKDRPADEAGG